MVQMVYRDFRRYRQVMKQIWSVTGEIKTEMGRRALQRTMPREETLRQEIVGLLPRLRRFARSLAKDPDKADDLVQAACERALERLTQVREGTRFDSWLYRIIYTRWIDKLRRNKTRTANLIVLSDARASVPRDNEAGDYLDTALDVKKALDTLPAEHQAAIALVSVEGYSYAEAAEVLDIPVGTVASRVARARTMLGRFLAHQRQQDFQRSNYRSGEYEK